MGATERSRPGPPIARPVWYHRGRTVTGGHYPDPPPIPALLLDWRQVQDSRDRHWWEGLIVWGAGGGELSWEVKMRWVGAGYLEQMSVVPPGDGAVERPGK